MANFIISPLAISFESIKNNLQQFAASLSEDRTWKDYYASSTGETIIEIIAALGAFYAYHFIMGRRESYLSVAENYSSVVGLAENNGYSCYRGNNLKGNLKIVPEDVSDVITIRKWDVIGQYGEYDVVAMNDEPIRFGGSFIQRERSFPIVIGNLKRQSVDTLTNDLTSFSFYSDKITEDFRLLLDNEEVPKSVIISDALKDYYITLTNPYGGIDVFYLQRGNYKYNANSILTCEFIEQNNIDASNMSIDKFNMFLPISNQESLNWASQINGFSITNRQVAKESIEQIKVRAPLFHETSMVIRSRKDYCKYLLLKNPELIQVNDRDVSPGLIEITYLKADGSYMTKKEKEEYLDLIEQARPTGVARATITEPIQLNKKLKITLEKLNNVDYASTLSSNIENILDGYSNKFLAEIDLNQIEHDIERLDGVKIARVSVYPEEWQSNKLYNLFDIISTERGNYYVAEFKRYSGTEGPPSTEPTSESKWSENVGDFVEDGDLKWEVVDSYQDSITRTWQPHTSYEKFNQIKNEVFTNGKYGYSGKDMPRNENATLKWGDERIEDANVIWQLIENPTDVQITSSVEWSPSTVFAARTEEEDGDIIRVAVNDSVLYYECIKCKRLVRTTVYEMNNYLAKSTENGRPDGSELYEDADGTLVWKLYSSENTLLDDAVEDWKPNKEYQVGDIVKVTNQSEDKPDESSEEEQQTIAYNYQGTVDTIDELPDTDNYIGDVYTVEQLGTNYIYTDSGWVQLTEDESSEDDTSEDESDEYTEPTVYYYILQSINGRSGNEEPSWTIIDEDDNEKTLKEVYDGDIVWRYLDDTRKILLGWNQVIDLTYEIEE